MHKYLKAIGFGDSVSKKDLVAVLQKYMNYKESMEDELYIGDDGSKWAEVKTYYGDNFGIIWCGHLVDEKEFELDYYMPFVDGVYDTKEEQPSIESKKDVGVFLGICDDIRIGVSLIFQVQNSRQCYQWIKENKELSVPAVAFSGLSLSGRVLLPIIKEEKNENERKEELQNRMELITAARKGDERAIETLTLEDMDTYSKLSRRIMFEDVFSIVDSSFMPYGLECDLYTIVADIVSVEKTINIITKEEVYGLVLSCNDFIFNIMINAKDLMGEPLAGRRFKGNLWLQGTIKDLG
ncbi:MAG: DUF3881 family protein [Lachnospiraceae bacterium]|nr:DUF3881 family protein [Lachnospiraceae bacterium]